MKLENTSRSRRALSVALVASLTAVAACERPAQPPAILPAAGGLRSDLSGDSRQRDDGARNRAWSVGEAGVFLHDRSARRLVEITLPSWQWIDAAYGCPPDLAIGPAGEAVVTSNIVPVLWRIDPHTLAVTVHELALDSDQQKDIGFSSLVYSAEHGAYLAVSEGHGSLWQIDVSLRQGRKVAQLTPVRDACSVASPRGAG